MSAKPKKKKKLQVIDENEQLKDYKKLKKKINRMSERMDVLEEQIRYLNHKYSSKPH